MKNEELLLEYDVIWATKDNNTSEIKSYAKTFDSLKEAINYQDYLWHNIKPEYSTIKTYYK